MPECQGSRKNHGFSIILGRRPCKVCKPVPMLFTAPITDAELNYREKKKTGALSKYNREMVEVELLGNGVVPMERGQIVGWCHNSLHKGALTKNILKSHDCLGKNCHFLVRNDQSPYWAQLELKKQSKEKRKAKVRAEQIQKAIEQDDMRILKESWQSYLDDMESDMHIVRVEKVNSARYKVFYVSDNTFADGNRYPEFLDTVKHLHPRFSLSLRHIRDVDGHFVTTDEYLSRSRK